MNQARRNVLRGAVSTSMLSVAIAAGILRPRQVIAGGMEGSLKRTMQALRGSNPVVTNAIQLRAPEIAADGSNVFIEFFCALPDVDALVVFVDRNPQPLVAAFQIAPEVVPALQMRIKVAQTAQVVVVARSAGQFYRTARTVKVTAGGCGVGLN
jgi:sulfur-oxidizing protein SoxY